MTDTEKARLKISLEIISGQRTSSDFWVYEGLGLSPRYHEWSDAQERAVETVYDLIVRALRED